MIDIPSPKRPLDADRLLECEEALEASFQDLLWRAVHAGWDEEEAANAIASLAEDHALAMLANN